MISVIMPVYNGEKYLREAIESILCQTYSDFEFIILDDGSTDSSLTIIKEYAKMDSRIIFITRKNKGLVATLNEGLELAKGDFIARMDADDISYPERFAKQIQYFANNPELFLVGTNFRNIYEVDISDEVKGRKARFEANVNEPINSESWRTDIFEDIKVLHPTWMVKKELFLKVGNYREYDSEDGEFLFRVACNRFPIGKVSEVLLDYRITQTSKSAIEGACLKNKREIIEFKFSYIERIFATSIHNLHYYIWGADQSGQIFYEMMKEKYPNAKCYGFIDGIKTGVFSELPIVSSDDIKESKNYIFICTNGGRKKALDFMRETKKNWENDFFKVV